MKMQAVQNITVDGKEYPLSSFSETAQRLVAIHEQWRKDLAEERLAVAKTEAAIRGLDGELSQLVAKELTEQAQVATTEVPAAE